MLAAIVSPIAAGDVPGWAVASFDGDIVLVPSDCLDEVTGLLRAAGHQIVS